MAWAADLGLIVGPGYISGRNIDLLLVLLYKFPHQMTSNHFGSNKIGPEKLLHRKKKKTEREKYRKKERKTNRKTERKRERKTDRKKERKWHRTRKSRNN